MSKRQASLASTGFERERALTRTEIQLAEMDEIIPWKEMCALIEPVYPKPEGSGRRPIGVEMMLRIHVLQIMYSLSDPKAEEQVILNTAYKDFVGVNLDEGRAPDETTICKFRHLLEEHDMSEKIFELFGEILDEKG